MTRGPFNFSDPHDRMSEEVRRAVLDTIANAFSKEKHLDDRDRLSAIISGVTTALCCTVVVCVPAQDRKKVMRTIAKTVLPEAMVLAESINTPGGVH